MTTSRSRLRQISSGSAFNALHRLISELRRANRLLPLSGSQFLSLPGHILESIGCISNPCVLGSLQDQPIPWQRPSPLPYSAAADAEVLGLLGSIVATSEIEECRHATGLLRPSREERRTTEGADGASCHCRKEFAVAVYVEREREAAAVSGAGTTATAATHVKRGRRAHRDHPPRLPPHSASSAFAGCSLILHHREMAETLGVAWTGEAATLASYVAEHGRKKGATGVQRAATGRRPREITTRMMEQNSDGKAEVQRWSRRVAAAVSSPAFFLLRDTRQSKEQQWHRASSRRRYVTALAVISPVFPAMELAGGRDGSGSGAAGHGSPQPPAFSSPVFTLLRKAAAAWCGGVVNLRWEMAVFPSPLDESREKR
nr:hypothetical protein Iba_chr10eCG11900 [Ipomoea batatas]